MEKVKKTGSGTPQDKVSKAVKAGLSVNKDLRNRDIQTGQSLDLEVMKSSWKELAIKVLARIPPLLKQTPSE